MLLAPPTDAAPVDDEDVETEALPAEQTMLVPVALGKAETLDTRSADMLSMNLNKLTFAKPPEIHNYPAPPTIPSLGDPALPHLRPPSISSLGKRRGYLLRFIDSTCGRLLLFIVNILISNLSIYGLVESDHPANRESGMMFYYWSMSMFFLLSMYTFPLAAEKAGMSALDTGWKPYLVLYRFSFVLTIPAVVFQLWGKGAEVAFGTAAGPPGGFRLDQLENTYWNYFELSDGFVALNLTKGIVETMAAREHGVKGHRRYSRFSDAELRINTEPYSDEVEPTEVPGRLVTYRIAPVFSNWATCVTRYRISTNCLLQNPVMAWAVSRSTSICSRLGSVGCRPPKPHLEPVYQCSTANDDGTWGIQGVGNKAEVGGVCGHVGLAPPVGALDELSALMLYDAWPKISLPSADHLWLDVSPDDCISQPDKCKTEWGEWYLVGLVFQILANLCIAIPAYYDCKVDRRIRDARRYFEMKETQKRLGQLKPAAPT
jgi:hypothetical protein